MGAGAKPIHPRHMAAILSWRLCARNLTLCELRLRQWRGYVANAASYLDAHETWSGSKLYKDAGEYLSGLTTWVVSPILKIELW
jgi:hypothetical protein